MAPKTKIKSGHNRKISGKGDRSINYIQELPERAAA